MICEYWTVLTFYQVHDGNVFLIHIQGVKNNFYNVSGMTEEVKTNKFFIWQNFGLCTVFPLDGLKCRCLDFRHNTHRLVLFVLLCLQQVERVITVLTNIHIIYSYNRRQKNKLCLWHIMLLHQAHQFIIWVRPCSRLANPVMALRCHVIWQHCPKYLNSFICSMMHVNLRYFSLGNMSVNTIIFARGTAMLRGDDATCCWAHTHLPWN